MCHFWLIIKILWLVNQNLAKSLSTNIFSNPDRPGMNVKTNSGLQDCYFNVYNHHQSKKLNFFHQNRHFIRGFSNLFGHVYLLKFLEKAFSDFLNAFKYCWLRQQPTRTQEKGTPPKMAHPTTKTQLHVQRLLILLHFQCFSRPSSTRNLSTPLMSFLISLNESRTTILKPTKPSSIKSRNIIMQRITIVQLSNNQCINQNFQMLL